MGIIIDKNKRVIVQGITGKQGRFHTKLMLQYGTKIVAGVAPGKGGTQIQGVPVYDTVGESIEKHQIDASILFVPAQFATEATLEALDNGIKIVVIITEHIPIKDAINVMAYAKKMQALIIGPNTPGIISVGECKLGIMPNDIFKAGNIGIVSRSGTLTYEITANLTKKNFGQSTCIGIGGDPIIGFNFIDSLQMFAKDSDTKAVVLIGEIGGKLEELAAGYILKNKYSKPVVAFIAGRSAPMEKRMGHAGAIIIGKAGTAKSKIEAFKKADVKIAEKPSDIAKLLTKVL